MKFFIPRAETPEASERIYQVISRQVHDAIPANISERRIFKIEFTHNTVSYEVEVGKNANFHEVVDEVMAIFEAESMGYLICTPSRGVDPRFPMPIIVGFNNTKLVEDFET